MAYTPAYSSYRRVAPGSSYNTSGTVGTDGPLPPGFTGTQGTAYTREVQPEGLVENRLVGLLGRKSPYIQQAEQAGLRHTAARGGLNGSIGAGASRAAAIQAGLPIASQDATSIENAAGQNLDALNQMSRQYNDNNTSVQVAGIGASSQDYATNMGLTRQRENLAYEGEQAGLQRSFQDYMRGQGFSEQMIQNQMQQQFGQQNAVLNAGLGMMGQNQAFNYSLANNAMSNPTLPTPQQLSGLSGWATGNLAQQLQQLFGFALGGSP